MEFELLCNEDGVVHIQTIGNITQDSIAQNSASSDNEPIKNLAGDTVYQNKIILDFNRADYMDSSGVSWLLVLHKRCRQAGGSLVLHSIPPIIRQVLDVLRLGLVLTIVDDEKQAREFVSGGAER